MRKRTYAELARELEDLRRELFAAPPMTVWAARKILARTKRLYDEELAEYRPVLAAWREFTRPNCDLS